MEAIRLEFQPEIKEKILELLSSFPSDQLRIVQEEPDFDATKKKANAIERKAAKYNFIIKEMNSLAKTGTE